MRAQAVVDAGPHQAQWRQYRTRYGQCPCETCRPDASGNGTARARQNYLLRFRRRLSAGRNSMSAFGKPFCIAAAYLLACAYGGNALCAGAPQAAWQPTKPVEYIVPAG